MKQGITRFFKYARARHGIYLNRMSGAPRPWSKDPIFEEHRFTNVFRELDKTTVWFRTHVRNPMFGNGKVILATVLFRLLNRIEVGEAIFLQTMLPLGRFKSPQGKHLTAWDAFHASGDVGILRHAIVSAIPNGPYCTGAYIISSPPGYTKLDGVLSIVKKFYDETRVFPGLAFGQDMTWRDVSNLSQHQELSLEMVWTWLKQFDYFGPFHSYEIVTDLRHTALLCNAVDINTWANPGPGARRGLNRVHGRDKKDHTVSRDGLIEEMRELLEFSELPGLWPRGQNARSREDWPAWEMREVEHTLCEFDKYERVRLGEGRPRGVYR